jgi:parvulin-like peptidyl-prolyl isomerase
MSKTITITDQDILHQIKISCKIPEIIENIITCHIIKDAASEAGIKMEVEELQEAADQFRLINQLNGSDKTWEWLNKHSLSLDDFEELVYFNLLSNKLLHHLFANQTETYFYEHQLDYTGVVMYEIILDDPDLALELFYGIQEGEMSFYDAAHQYIQETELRRKGGYKGIVQRQELKPEISAAVFAAKPPQVLKPILTSKGVHLIRVEEIIEPELNQKLRSQIMVDLFSEWLKQQIQQVEVLKS